MAWACRCTVEWFYDMDAMHGAMAGNCSRECLEKTAREMQLAFPESDAVVTTRSEQAQLQKKIADCMRAG